MRFATLSGRGGVPSDNGGLSPSSSRRLVAGALAILLGTALLLPLAAPTVALARPIPGGGAEPPPNAPPPRPEQPVPNFCLDVRLALQDNQTVPTVQPAPGEAQVIDATATITNNCGATLGLRLPTGAPVGTPTWGLTPWATCPPNPDANGQLVEEGFIDPHGNLPALEAGRSTTLDFRVIATCVVRDAKTHAALFTYRPASTLLTFRVNAQFPDSAQKAAGAAQVEAP